MSYEQKLMAMKQMLRKKEPKKQEEQKPTKRTIPKAPSYEENWLQEGFLKEENELGIVYKRVVKYNSDYFHGNIQLGELHQAINKWRNFEHAHPLAPDLSKRLVFFDTETTGLKGTGTLIFLLGFIEESQEGFTLTQYVLPGPDHEAAFLYASNFWQEPLSLVTYNGKSFDMPQVETRWTMNRRELPPLLAHHQIDLLHGARRVWKTELETFKLTTIEQSQLQFKREGDIPGHLAPIIYQDAVKSGRAKALMKVLQHNEWDILSLVTLYIRATNLLLESEHPETAASHTNIGKWFADLKLYEDSAPFFEQVIQKYGSNHPLTHYHYGFYLKRNEEYEKAIQAFRVSADQLMGRERIIALEEIAKLYEHKIKDLKRALKATEEASSFISVDEYLTKRFQQRAMRDFEKRAMRLQRKLLSR